MTLSATFLPSLVCSARYTVPMGPSTRLPSTKVPFREPRSRSTTCPWGSTSSWACRRETRWSSTTTSQEGSRPITTPRPRATVRLRPSAEWTMTFMDAPARRFYGPPPAGINTEDRGRPAGVAGRRPASPVLSPRGQGLLLLRHRLRGRHGRGLERPRPGEARARHAVRLQEHEHDHRAGRGPPGDPLVHRGPAEGRPRGAPGENGPPGDPAEGALTRPGPARRAQHLQDGRAREPRHLRREGPRAHEVREGPVREGPEPGPGRPGPDHREEEGRPPGRHQGRARARVRPRAPVHELPALEAESWALALGAGAGALVYGYSTMGWLGAVPIFFSISFRRATRSAVGGWVENRLAKDMPRLRPLNGFMMNRWA